MRRRGLSISAIARKTGLCRKTIRQHLKRGLENPVYGPRHPRPRLLDPYEGYLRERVESCPGLSGKRLLEVQHHPDEIRIFEDGRPIACHPVLSGKNQSRVDPTHRPAPPVARGWSGPSAVPASLEIAVARRSLAFYDIVAQRMAGVER